MDNNNKKKKSVVAFICYKFNETSGKKNEQAKRKKKTLTIK